MLINSTDYIPRVTLRNTTRISQTSNIAGGKISGFERKAFTRQNYPDSKVFEFKVPTLDSGFKVSGDMTKPGYF